MTVARKVNSGLLMEVLIRDSEEEWRSALMTSGEQCVTMDGM